MIHATRQNLLRQLTQLSELAPEMRLGQLIANLANMVDTPWEETLWEIEDEKLLEVASVLAAELEQRSSSAV